MVTGYTVCATPPSRIEYTVCATPPGCISRDHVIRASLCSRVLVSVDAFSPRSRLYIALF